MIIIIIYYYLHMYVFRYVSRGKSLTLLKLSLVIIKIRTIIDYC